MKVFRSSLIAALLTAGALLAPGIAQAALTDQTMSLDTHSNGNAGSGGAVTTDDLLPAGKLYVVIASGTYSKWKAASWGSHCGTPESQPITPSPGATNGPVGLDAETLFAYKRDPGKSCFKLPAHQPGLFMRIAPGEFKHREPFGGAPTSPTPDHTYQYAIKGEGIAASFKILDRPVDDNYGVLRIRVRLATAADCPQAFHSWEFPTEQDCEAFFASGSNAVSPTTVQDLGPGPIGANFVISRRPVRITRSGAIGVRVSCRSPLSCRGSIFLRTFHKVALHGKKATRVKFGKTITFEIPPKSRNHIIFFKVAGPKRALAIRQAFTTISALAHVFLGRPQFHFDAAARFQLRKPH